MVNPPSNAEWVCPNCGARSGGRPRSDVTGGYRREAASLLNHEFARLRFHRSLALLVVGAILLLASRLASAETEITVQPVGDFVGTGNECAPEIRAELLTMLQQPLVAFISTHVVNGAPQIQMTMTLDRTNRLARAVTQASDGRLLGFFALSPSRTFVIASKEDRVELMLIQRLDPVDRGHACYVRWRGPCLKADPSR